MSCCSEKICINGRTYDANFVKRPDGSIVSGTYTDENFNIQNITAGSFVFGECSYKKHVATISGRVLTLGSNTITHNLNLSNPIVAYAAYDVANNNQQITFDVGNFTANSFDILNTPAGNVGMVINIIVTGEG
jgi:hypothetical protein